MYSGWQYGHRVPPQRTDAYVVLHLPNGMFHPDPISPHQQVNFLNFFLSATAFIFDFADVYGVITWRD